MSKPLPFSISIICHNEKSRLEKVLQSIAGLAEDVVIVDSGSTDGTIELAKTYTKRVMHRDWEGYGQQKVFAEQQCTFDWILNLDADEILLGEVKANIRKVFEVDEEKRAAAYSLRFCNVSSLAKSLKPHPLAPVNVTPRLYNRKKAGFNDSAVHDKVVTYDGSKPKVLAGDVAHISFKSFGHVWEKTQFYAELQAEDWYKKGRNPGWLRLMFDPPTFFFKQYFLRRFCFLGLEGLVISLILAAGRVLRIGLTMEKCRKNSS